MNVVGDIMELCPYHQLRSGPKCVFYLWLASGATFSQPHPLCELSKLWLVCSSFVVRVGVAKLGLGLRTAYYYLKRLTDDHWKINYVVLIFNHTKLIQIHYHDN